ncbi:MAG: cation-transporting P-type ATPase [Candidatus Daviesbacteria bacterium]|nr:cation-transporting P-type ATPase [Candidatus Daviesbacteria bacterium]
MREFTGITDTEAIERLKKYGPNEIKDLHRISPLTILFRQVKKNFIVYLLIIAALISFVVGKALTGYTISAVIFMVIAVGFIQEYRAEKAISSLKKMIMPVSIVIRGGKRKEIPSQEIVPGDIVILGNGEKIPADCLILDESELRVNESSLTGESKEVRKVKAKSEDETAEESMLFMGTYIVNGRAVTKVMHTGMNTRFGSIAGMISIAEKELPLQNKVNQISKYMATLAIIVSLLTGALMFFQAETITPEVVTNILILIIALSVSAFPEGFPVVLITTLAAGVANMAKKNAIVNRMSIIETLGETTVICSDKTGTLTRGEMTVKRVFVNGKNLEISGSGFEGKGSFLQDGNEINPLENEDLKMLLKTAVSCNDAKIERTGEDFEYKVTGSPTEGALLILAAKANIFEEDIKGERIEEMPFNSDRKMMSVMSKEEGFFIFSKGAPEVILEKCKISPEERHKILEANHKMNSDALRTLAFGYKKVNSGDKLEEAGLIFLGLAGMEDPPREEVPEAIALCKNANIKVKMITGDNKQTAFSIASQIGLEGEILEGFQMDALSDEELTIALDKTVIFARVKPEHKIRIVRLLKQKGEIVTMTGDGVNDAPALKEAHIGVAMGNSGTDVSRSVADLTLKDDNFATIVEAVKEGRTIFNNIRKFVSYQLSCNLAELAILFIGVLLSPLLGWQVPLLLALHILFMNLVTDNLPAITLGFNPASKDIMQERPRKDTRILNKELIFLVLFNGALMAGFTLSIYFIFFNILGQGAEVARTAALVGLILLEIASAFNFRSFRKKSLSRSPFVNKYLFFASFISILATLIIIYTTANKIFETVPLNIYSWVVLMGPVVLILLIYDILKDYSIKSGRFLTELT